MNNNNLFLINILFFCACLVALNDLFLDIIILHTLEN